MREIKFRIWDEKYKCWEIDRQEFYPEQTLVEQGRIYQQFTGLKDKNGKEIYEGDIIRSINNQCIYEVIWDEYEESHAQYVGFKLKCYHLTGKPYISSWGNQINQKLLSLDCRYEIIGNTFENPELLKND